MKLIKDKKVLLYVLGIIAGVALVFTPVMLGGVESKILGYVYVWAGIGIFFFSLIFLERYISKRKLTCPHKVYHLLS